MNNDQWLFCAIVKDLQGYGLYQLANVLVSQGDIEAGRAKFQESATVRHQIGEKLTEAESPICSGAIAT